MENLEFILGMLTTIGLLALGFATMGVFRVSKRSNDLEMRLNHTERIIDDNYLQAQSLFHELEKRMDNNTRELFQHSDNLNDNKSREIEELYRHIDSRFDKFENRLKVYYNIHDDDFEKKQSKELITE